jgi:DNA-binding NarL/FixJ family response regulator
VAPDLAEAALATGDSALADEVIDRLAQHSGEQEHPWGLASVRRCEALRALTRDVGSAAARAMMLAAVDEYEKLGCRFDAARSLLVLGRQARRGRKWAAAREALSRAVEIFDELGCDGWSAVAQGLLDGLGGRRPAADGTLTPSERRVVELASQGLSNREIAASLYVSEHTVEVHLAHAYPKLGVTSRVQLGAAMRPKI